MDNRSDIYQLIFVVYGIALVFALIIAVATYVVMAIALTKFFAKVGVEPWIGWVPIYAYWKWLEIGGQKGALSLLMLVPYGSIATSVFLYIGMYRTGIAFRKEGTFLVLGIFLPFVWAFMLARPQETYQPELITQAGYPPPLAGYGSVVGPATQPPPAATPPAPPMTPPPAPPVA